MNIIIPITGSIYLDSSDFFYPKPLIDINGEFLIEKVINFYKKIPNIKFTVIINSCDDKKWKFSNIFENIIDEKQLNLVKINNDTAGSLCTTLLAMEYINDNEPFLIANYDQIISFNIEESINIFLENKVDFGLFTFKSNHPRWSYVDIDENKQVIEAAEKKPISSNALAGLYYYKNKSIYIDAAKKCILEASVDKSKFFVSDTINYCILNGNIGNVISINKNDYYKLTDPNDFKNIPSKILQLDNSILYFEALKSGNIEEIMSYFTDESVIYDVDAVFRGIYSIKKLILGLLSQNIFSDMIVSKISTDNSTTFVEFEIENIKLIDVIKWENGKINHIKVYKNENP